MIKLVQDTIDKQDIISLKDWLDIELIPRLTQGPLVEEFEEKWSKWLGCKYSTFVNSGSSANLLMLYSTILNQKLRNKNIIVPAVSWTTTVAPIIQLGYNPILCDTDKDNLGVDINHLKSLIKKYKPSILMIVQVLGFPNKMKEILEICDKYNIILLEDSCETVGSTYKNKKIGNFGLMSSFSFYYGHHISTIEGGMVCTNNSKINNILKMIRNHGWDRSLSKSAKNFYRRKYNISGFKSLYSFYEPGFNLRSSDLNAHIGLNQLKKLNNIVRKRYKNFMSYQSLIKNDYWKINVNYEKETISNFAYPIIHPKRDIIVKNLTKNEIECRPLICGSMSKQPFFYNRYGKIKLNFAEEVDNYGLYIPNNHELTTEQINKISYIVNWSIK